MLSIAVNGKAGKRSLSVVILGALMVGLLMPSSSSTAPSRPTQPGEGPVAVNSSRVADFGKLPLSFEPNAGQTDPSVRFTAHAPGGMVYFTPSEVVLAIGGSSGSGVSGGPKDPKRGALPRSSKVPGLAAPAPSGDEDQAQPPSIVRMQFIGASRETNMAGGDQLAGRVNYFIGNDPYKWHTNLPTYSGIEYKDIYPGIDLSYSGTGADHLKGTYTVAPGANPASIRWSYQGASTTSVDGAGNLQVSLGGSNPVTITEQAPLGWQEVDGKRVQVQIDYALQPEGTLGFHIGR